MPNLVKMPPSLVRGNSGQFEMKICQVQEGKLTQVRAGQGERTKVDFGASPQPGNGSTRRS